MRCLRYRSGVFTAFLLTTLGLAVALPGHAQNRNPDSGLLTIYHSPHPATSISWSTCGYLQQGDGCYGSGTFEPFVNACSIVQSVPQPLNLSTVLRYIYILDAGSTAGGATLTAYRRTDTVSPSSDTISITQVATVPLPSLVAGPGATCWMVQNPTYVYAATAQGQIVATVNKTSFAVGSIGGFGLNVTALTADSYGYVTVDWGSGSQSENAEFGPNGQTQFSGGGSYFMITTIDGVNPLDYPAF